MSAPRDPSREAFERIRPALPQLRARILEAIVAAGPKGATCDELEVRLEMPHQTVSARIRELVEDSLIADSLRRRPTRRGMPATVWVPLFLLGPDGHLTQAPLL